MYYQARNKALNNGRQYHLCAILRRKGRVVAIGENTNKTHPKFKRRYPDGSVSAHMHAEMNVLRFAKPGDELEVMRFRNNGTCGMAKPCTHCMKYIEECCIKKVRYTDSEGNWQEIRV